MKFIKTLQKTTALFMSFVSAAAWADNSALVLLKRMFQAENTLNYERSFVQITPTDIESLCYRHARIDDISYAQLITLDGGRQEILQRGGLVAYFNSGFRPFTIRSSQIVESQPLPAHANFSLLGKYYDFVNIGRNRVANRVVQTVKILPKDNFRYQYVLFIDEESHLLLRSDLLDRNGQILEQFRVVKLHVGDELIKLAEHFQGFHFPPLVITDPETESTVIEQKWQAGWLPQGFQHVKSINEDYNNAVVESQIYSDGLFSFTLYVSQSRLPDKYENGWNQGVRTIYSETNNGKDITLIGELPLAVAKRIVQDIKFM